MKKRKKLNKDTEAKIFCLCRRRCCVCYGLNRDTNQKSGQIAHLDKNPYNNNLNNLAFLCFDHHDQYDTVTSQSKNLTITEVKKYRTELYKTINKKWNQPLKLGDELYCLDDEISGRYVRESESSSAEIELKYLGNNGVRVNGFALWGKTRGCPHVGELHFEAEIKENIIEFSDKITLKPDEYKLKLKLTSDGLYAEENRVSGYFGMNVTFVGDYKKV